MMIRTHKTAMLSGISVITAIFFMLSWPGAQAEKANAGAPSEPVFMANGVKIGEVTPTTAIIWTRLTRQPDANWLGVPFPDASDEKRKGVGMKTLELTGGHALEEMEGSAPGAPGYVRVSYWPETLPDSKAETDWFAVDEQQDFTRQIGLDKLSPETQYLIRVEGKSMGEGTDICAVDGRFRTAPLPDSIAATQFVAVTCGDYPRRDDAAKGHKIYDAMLTLQPDFFVHTGDIEYYDKALPYAVNQELARFKWNRFFALPYQRAFFLNTSSYFVKDDHDALKNDCWPGQRYGDLTWEQGLGIFREQVPMGGKTYRTVRWGRDLQLWLVEGRDYRSPNTLPDGPNKSIWGAEQKAWFKRTVQESDATFRILISPTPLVGPDRDSKNDNHANEGFAHEGRELRQFISEQKNMIVINGDRHWQYVSVDEETGIYEFGTGPSSDSHAGGWDADDVRPEHRYLNLKGGFLRVTVNREGDTCRMILQHHGVNGELNHEEVIEQQNTAQR